jgi:hypothetical protein
MFEMRAFNVGFGLAGASVFGLAHLYAKLSLPKAGDFFDATVRFQALRRHHHDLRSSPNTDPATANMEGEKYSTSLIRLWRVWRTTKEMMNDRVGCTCT